MAKLKQEVTAAESKNNISLIAALEHAIFSHNTNADGSITLSADNVNNIKALLGQLKEKEAEE